LGSALFRVGIFLAVFDAFSITTGGPSGCQNPQGCTPATPDIGTTTTTKDDEQRFVMVYHGSINNASTIRANGLDPTRLPAVITRDINAAADAIDPRKRVDPIDTSNSGIISSRIPEQLFMQHFAPYERPYQGFYPYTLRSTEIPLRTPLQVTIFNTYILR
jgi:hypothetical protein